MAKTVAGPSVRGNRGHSASLRAPGWCAAGWRWAIPALALAAAGCRRGESPVIAEAPPATVLERLTGTPVTEALGMLDRELATALRAGLQGAGGLAFVRAEAISDRLLETRFPFDWLRIDSYSVQARIRQIQAQADRIDALLRTGAPHDSASADLRRLRQAVLSLRRDLAQGGGPRPTPLERLLAGRDTLNLFSSEAIPGD